MIASGIIENALLIGMFARPEAPIPDQDKFKNLLLQAEVVARISETNSALFGQASLFCLCHDFLNMYFFHLARYHSSGRKGILAVMLSQPYVHEEVISLVSKYLKEK